MEAGFSLFLLLVVVVVVVFLLVVVVLLLVVVVQPRIDGLVSSLRTAAGPAVSLPWARDHETSAPKDSSFGSNRHRRDCHTAAPSKGSEW